MRTTYLFSWIFLKLMSSGFYMFHVSSDQKTSKTQLWIKLTELMPQQGDDIQLIFHMTMIAPGNGQPDGTDGSLHRFGLKYKQNKSLYSIWWGLLWTYWDFWCSYLVIEKNQGVEGFSRGAPTEYMMVHIIYLYKYAGFCLHAVTAGHKT